MSSDKARPIRVSIDSPARCTIIDPTMSDPAAVALANQISPFSIYYIFEPCLLMQLLSEAAANVSIVFSGLYLCVFI